MKSLFVSVLAASAALLSAIAMPTMAQSFYVDHIIEPASNHPAPSGNVRQAHTFVYLVKTTRDHRSGARPMVGIGPYGGMTPAQVTSGYGVPANAGSKIIALVDAYDYSTALSDFNSFSKYFGLPKEPSTVDTAKTNKVFQKVFASGVRPPDASYYGWDVEEALDIEWSHAMSPKAKIVLIESDDQSLNALMVGVDKAITNQVKANEVSMSWGYDEFFGETSYDSHFPLGKGTVYFAATGDSGSPLFGYTTSSYPAGSPYVVAVGGTTFVTEPAGGYLYDIGWELGGGSPGTQEARPSYQNGVANTDPIYRSIPDIAAIADPYTGAAIYIYAYGGWNVVGGTSLASPVIAGIVNAAGSFLPDSVAENTKIYSGLGGPNIIDVQYGFNGYPCLPGYDFVTGVGVPHGLKGL